MQSGTFLTQFLPYELILKILSGSTFPKTELGFQITYKMEHNDLGKQSESQNCYSHSPHFSDRISVKS